MAQNEAHELLVRNLLVALSATKLCMVWRQDTGAAYRNDRLIRYGLIGSADISGILIGGKRLEIECKTGRAVQTEGQINFQKMIMKMGGIYILARDVISVVKKIQSEAAGI
jgi:hypothetical protein